MRKVWYACTQTSCLSGPVRRVYLHGVAIKMRSPLTCPTNFFKILISAMDDQDRKNAEEYKRHGKDKQARALDVGIASSSYEACSGEAAQMF